MITKNAFIFAWDTLGIDAIVPITRFEYHDKENLIRMLKDEKVERNPLNGIIRRLVLRARYNSQRYYEIYAIDCIDPTLDEAWWRKAWEENPQYWAELFRKRGHKIYSDREKKTEVKIT
jgi:hypothetical protein